MRKLVIFVVIGVALSFVLVAQPPDTKFFEEDGASSWKAIGPNGGYIPAIAANPANPGELFALTSSWGIDQEQVYRSTNNGASWKRIAIIEDWPFYCIALDPNDLNVIYALSDYSIYKSTDKGATWVRYPLGGDRLSSNGTILVSPANSNTVFVTGYRLRKTGSTWRRCMAVFQSINAGRTWASTQLQPDSDPGDGQLNKIVISPSQPHILFVAGYVWDGNKPAYYMYKSENGGQTWTRATAPQSYPSGFVIHPFIPNRLYYACSLGVYRSYDGGISWQVNNGNLNACSLTIDQYNSNILYAGWLDYCYKSTDGGINWTASLTSPKGSFNHIEARGASVHIGTEAGIFRSINAGVDFKWTQKGIIALDIYSLAIAPSLSSTIYAGSNYGGFYHSTNAGLSWTKLPNFNGTNFILKIIVDPKEANKVFAISGYTSNKYVYRSLDAGQTWAELLTQPIEDLALASSNPQIVFAAGQATSEYPSMGVHISSNGGNSWTSKRISSVAGSKALAVDIDPRTAKVVYVGGHRDDIASLFKSIDGGVSWKNVTKGLDGNAVLYIAIDPRIPNRVYIATNEGLYRTDNGGKSWMAVLYGYEVNSLAFHPNKSKTVYVASSEGVFKSEDAGDSWTWMEGLTFNNVQCLSTHRSIKSLYAGTLGGSVFRIQQ